MVLNELQAMGDRRERELAAIIEPNLDPAHAMVRLGIDRCQDVVLIS